MPAISVSLGWSSCGSTELQIFLVVWHLCLSTGTFTLTDCAITQTAIQCWFIVLTMLYNFIKYLDEIYDPSLIPISWAVLLMVALAFGVALPGFFGWHYWLAAYVILSVSHIIQCRQLMGCQEKHYVRYFAHSDFRS